MPPRVPVEQSRILASPHPFKLATFGFNAQGGTTITKAPGTVQADDWGQQVRIAQLSEQAGIEALLPGARWVGYGGETNFQGRSYDTFTWAAALAAVTSTTQVFATYHVPTAHPVRIAKTIATIDQISGGRFGVNIVAGWNTREIEMFGGSQREHDERYEYADEFFAAVNTMLDGDGFTDIDGNYFTIPGAYSEPKPIQSPRPVYMAAGMSPRGRQFAADNADISFMPIGRDPQETVGVIADSKARAAANGGKDLKIFAQAQIVCADTEEEAQEYVRWYVDELGDTEAAANIMQTLMAETRRATDGSFNEALETNPFLKMMLRRMVAGHGAELIVGTPETIVAGLQRISDLGFDGTTVSWVDYEAGLVQFRERILPLMIEAGLRVEEPATG